MGDRLWFERAAGGGGGGGGAAAAKTWLVGSVTGNTNIGGQFWFVPGAWYQSYPSVSRREFCGFSSKPSGTQPRVLSAPHFGLNLTGVGGVAPSVTKLKGVLVRAVNALTGDEGLTITVEKRNFGAWADLAGGSVFVDASVVGFTAFTALDYALVDRDTFAVRCDVDQFPTASLFEAALLFE